MRLSAKQARFSVMVARLILWAETQGFALTFGEVWRSSATQEIYVERGLSKTMDSKHLERLAVDFNLFMEGNYITTAEPWRALGEKWEEFGGVWGGRFGVERKDYDTEVGWDPGHFEYAG